MQILSSLAAIFFPQNLTVNDWRYVSDIFGDCSKERKKEEQKNRIRYSQCDV